MPKNDERTIHLDPCDYKGYTHTHPHPPSLLAFFRLLGIFSISFLGCVPPSPLTQKKRERRFGAVCVCVNSCPKATVYKLEGFAQSATNEDAVETYLLWCTWAHNETQLVATPDF